MTVAAAATSAGTSTPNMPTIQTMIRTTAPATPATATFGVGVAVLAMCCSLSLSVGFLVPPESGYEPWFECPRGSVECVPHADECQDHARQRTRPLHGMVLAGRGVLAADAHVDLHHGFLDGLGHGSLDLVGGQANLLGQLHDDGADLPDVRVVVHEVRGELVFLPGLVLERLPYHVVSGVLQVRPGLGLRALLVV